MHAAAVLIGLCAAFAASPSSISGVVHDASGRPLPGARVFLETGLLAPLVETRTDGQGRYSFPQVPPTPSAGVFAIADGHAFGGESTRVSLAQAITDHVLRLARSAAVSGRVLSADGRGVPGARVTRAAVPDSRIAVPLAKLESFGFPVPRTDNRGQFTLDRMPAGATIDLKVVHPEFAQEGAAGIAVGSRDARIILDRGVLVTGTVVTRGTNLPVANTNILVRKSDPPLDTVVLRSFGDGGFSTRLKPGAYVVEAAGGLYRTASGVPLLVTGQSIAQQMTIHVAGVGAIRGVVRDAVSGNPIDGARLVLEAHGLPAAVEVTGPSGEYQFAVAAGPNVIAVESVPGFNPPVQGPLEFNVNEGHTVEHNFWLAPIAHHTLQVFDTHGEPEPNAAIRILRPPQLGWTITGPDGRATLTLAQAPPGNRIFGLVETTTGEPCAALFAIDTQSREETAVQLLPLGTITARVVASNGSPVEGARAAAHFVDDTLPEPLLLWQTLSAPGGTITWRGVIPHLPQTLAAHVADENETSGQTGHLPFILAEDLNRDLGDIILAESTGETPQSSASSPSSLLGKTLNWSDRPRQCGPAPNAPNRPALVVYCKPADAPVYADVLHTLRGIHSLERLNVVIVANGPVACPPDSPTILLGSNPGAAEIYITDSSGKVVLETFDLPPLHALASLTHAP